MRFFNFPLLLVTFSRSLRGSSSHDRVLALAYRAGFVYQYFIFSKGPDYIRDETTKPIPSRKKIYKQVLKVARAHATCSKERSGNGHSLAVIISHMLNVLLIAVTTAILAYSIDPVVDQVCSGLCAGCSFGSDELGHLI